MEEYVDPFLKEFCRRVERRRRILALTQREVAAMLGMHQGQYSRLERMGYYSMRLQQLARLADILQTSLDYLLLRTNEDPGPVPDERWRGEETSFAGTTLLPATP